MVIFEVKRHDSEPIIRAPVPSTRIQFTLIEAGASANISSPLIWILWRVIGVDTSNNTREPTGIMTDELNDGMLPPIYILGCVIKRILTKT